MIPALRPRHRKSGAAAKKRTSKTQTNALNKKIHAKTKAPKQPQTNAQTHEQKIRVDEFFRASLVGLLGFTAPRPTQYQDQDLADIILSIRQRHVKYAKLLLVPHSQGNLYANLVYDQLTTPPLVAEFPPQSLLMAHIANPATTLRTGLYHVTSDADLLMRAVRWVVPATPAPNALGMPYTLAEPIGHKFAQVYLTIEPAKTKTITLISQRLSQLRTTAPDPQAWIRVRSYGMICGQSAYPTGYPGPYACYMDVPTGTYPQWWTNVNINLFSTTNIPQVQHAIGTPADLEPINRARMTGCYAWYLSDRINVIKTAGYVPPSQWYYPYHLHSGSCGAGFPWMTPYGNPDVAWMIYSADSSRTTARSWTEGFNYYNDVEMFPVCRRA